MNAESSQNYEPLRNYLWKYFEYHASQRLTTFNFYIVISTLITTGYFLALRDVPWLAIFLGILVVVLSFIFWKLDCRNRILIRNSIEALEYIEARDKIEEEHEKPHLTQIFLYDWEQTIEGQKNKSPWFWKRHLKYATCLNWVFGGFGVTGILAMGFAIINIIQRL